MDGEGLQGNNTSWEVMQTTTGGKDAPPYKHLGAVGQAFVTTFYLIGVAGNLAALFIIFDRKAKKYKNKKHNLMLTCMVSIDLVSILGMLVQMYILLYAPPHVSNSHISCVFRVVWRVFGLASGCVASVMAVERWLALTHPFFYQKNVTHHALLKAIFFLWTAALALVSLPFIGFGLYFDEKESHCMRYRSATTPTDVAYAYLFFTFGILLCLVISFANLSVTRSLCSPRSRRSVRRISRSLSRSISTSCSTKAYVNTPDELAFARLMVAFSISFLLCWLPQMLTIPLTQLVPKSTHRENFFKLADILMAVHFTIDPYIYVLLHHQFNCLKITFDSVHRVCCCSTNESHDQSTSDDTEHSHKLVTL